MQISIKHNKCVQQLYISFSLIYLPMSRYNDHLHVPYDQNFFSPSFQRWYRPSSPLAEKGLPEPKFSFSSTQVPSLLDIDVRNSECVIESNHSSNSACSNSINSNSKHECWGAPGQDGRIECITTEADGCLKCLCKLRSWTAAWVPTTAAASTAADCKTNRCLWVSFNELAAATSPSHTHYSSQKETRVATIWQQKCADMD